MSDRPETYLGDGLYASFDGWHVILRAPREHGDHHIAMEPEVVIAFRRYLGDLTREHPALIVQWRFEP